MAVTMLCVVTWPAQRCRMVTVQADTARNERESPKIVSSREIRNEAQRP